MRERERARESGCVCVYDPISPPEPHFGSLIFKRKKKKSLVILTISKSRGKKKLKYPGIYVEEEQVFVNCSAMLSINVMEVKVWQKFNLTIRKLHINYIQKWVMFCTMEDI